MENTGQVVEQSEEQLRKDIEAGFNAAVSGEAPTETAAPNQEPTGQSQPEPAAAPAPEVSQPAAEPPPEPVIAGFKESDLKALLGRIGELDNVKDELRKAHGRYGALKDLIEERVKSIQTHTVAGKVRVKPQALERLKAEIGDEFASIFTDFIEADGQQPEPQAQSAAQPAAVPAETPHPAAVDQAEVDRRVQERVREEAAQIEDRISKNAAIQMLEFRHPDRKQIRDTAEYKQWLGTLPAEDLNLMQTGWDAAAISAKLDLFKQWNSKRLANEKRARSAVPATTGGFRSAPAIVPEEEAIRQGFDSVFDT